MSLTFWGPGILLVEEILVNQLRLVVYPIIYDGFIYGRWLAGFLNHQTVPSHVEGVWKPFG